MADWCSLSFLLVIAALFSGCSCVRWSSGPEDSSTIYACAQGTLSLPWALSVSTGDVIENIQWFFSGRSQELIATEAHGNYFTTPAFSGRVSRIHNAGIRINNMTLMEKGNYSVEVLVRTAHGSLSTLWRSVYVNVADNLQTVDGNLHVHMQSVAMYNNLTGQYHVVLRCGTFTYPGSVPFQATWLTPRQQTLTSSSFKDGQFLLLLPNPVQGGHYFCHVPPSSTCLHGETGVAEITVDSNVARLVLLETRQTSSERKNRELENKNRELEHKNRELENKATALEHKTTELENKTTELEDKTTELENKEHSMETEISDLKGELNRTVTFHATLSADLVNLTSHSTIVLGEVVTNIGGAYSPTTGKFTAPYEGSYFFIGSTEHKSSNGYEWIHLVVDGVVMDTSETLNGQYLQLATVHAVVHLRAGQKVWLRSDSSTAELWSSATAFSGFLVNYAP